jgi:hypothetical protein
MKKIFLFLLFIPLFSFGQQAEIPANKNEFGLNLFSLKRFQIHQDYEMGRSFYGESHLLPGIFYKRHFGKNAFRTSFEFTRRATQGNGKGAPWYFPEGSSVVRKNVGISIGYERSFSNKKLQPFAFADLVFNYENLAGTMIIQGYGTPDELYQFVFEDFEYSLSAGVGLRYQFTSRIQATYEISAQGFRNVYQEVFHAGDKYWDMGFHMNPVNKLGLSLSF